MRLRLSCLFSLLLLVPGFAAAQSVYTVDAAPGNMPARPRIGLVLSGGGARGVAHVGVLKVIDELRIPIDAIAGTSMGAVVGGLYASGLTARQIEALMSSVDWQDAFRDRPPRYDLNFRRKRDDTNFLVQLPLGIKAGKFLIPRGFIQGQKLGQILRELTLPIARIDDFNLLPTPFRAVATDLETGQPVLLSSGDLGGAIRASVSAPGVFTPVEYEDRLLVDGGISENLPIEVVRAMGVDRLIVVDVGFPLLKRERLSSVANISNQMLAILIRRDSERQRSTLTPQDVYIEPELGEYSSFDFGRIVRTISVGEKAARDLAPQLVSLGIDAASYESYVARRAAVRSAPPRIDFVRAEPGSERYAQRIEQTFGDLKGASLDVDNMGQRVSRFYGQGTLELLDYRLVRDADQYGLMVRARRNSWGPNYVRFGLRLQDDFQGNSNFDAAVRFVMTEMNSLGAEWLFDLQVGESPRLGTEAYLPLSFRQRYFFAPRAEFAVRNLPQVENEQQVGEFRLRSTRLGLDFGREFGSSAELRAGVERESGSSRLRLGDTQAPRTDFHTREIFGRYSYDALDNVSFPREGQALRFEWRSEIDNQVSEQYSASLTVDYRYAYSRGRNTAIFWASGGTLLDPEDATVRSYFPLGGFLNLSGLTPDALSGPHFGIARFIYYRKIGSGGEGFLNVPVYLGASFEAGNAWARRGDVGFGDARKDASLFLGLDTYLGPAYFAAGYDDHGRSAFYLFLGRRF
ncbi:MAG: patatin-like phospholipase family protein [Steroidobacteraceae bacterium]